MHRAAFLDRDGTINIDKDYLYRIEDFEYIPGAVEGLRMLQEAGFLLIVITNQSGIARGYYKEEDYHRLDAWMKADLEHRGVHITASYFCPHLPDGLVKEYRRTCGCRKPGTALFEQAVREYDIDPAQSVAIGDRERDLAFCKVSGCRGILLGRKGECRDLYAAAELICTV